MLDPPHPLPAPPIAGLAEIADRYDYYLVDLWGTLHNGVAPFPGAVECLQRLTRAGKTVCLLSNAPRRVASVAARLDEMGVPRSAWNHAMSSGEATHLALKERRDPWHAALGRRCYHLGPPRDNDVREDAGLELVAAIEDADFVLATGVHDYADRIERYEPELRAAAARRLPMVCANPDLVVVVGERMSICAGTMAQRYEELGGEVRYHGKPHPAVYETCFRLMASDDRRRILAIGDSLRTDIAGANAAGIDSLLLAGGIHAEEFAATPPVPAAGERPTWFAPRLEW